MRTMYLAVIFGLCGFAGAQVKGNGINAGSVDYVYAPGEQAFPADSFVDSAGYVTHVQYNTAGNYYANLPALVSLLKASGIRHVRDGWANDWTASSYETQGYNTMVSAGMKLTLLMANQPTESGLNTFQTYVGGGVEAWEGYNECDGSSTPSATCNTAVSWLPAELASAKDLGIPAIGPSNGGGNLSSLTGNIQSLITAKALHTYRDNNQPPEDTAFGNLTNAFGYGYASLSWWMTNATNAVNLPLYVTEVGYRAENPAGSGELTEIVQAKYLARTLLLNYKFGVKRTFLYELFDEASSPDWGVIHSDLTPKPAYTYIKNLLLTLTDPGGVFQPKKLIYKIRGGDANLQHLLLQKRDGTFYLILWLGEPAGSVTPEDVSLTVSGASLQSVSKFDDSGGITIANSTSASFAITDHLTVLTFK